MKEIKVLKAYKDHKEFIIHANNIINNVNDTEQTNGLKENIDSFTSSHEYIILLKGEK